MHYRALKITYLEDVKIKVTYQDGTIVKFDISTLFFKYPQFKILQENRELFMMGRLDPGGYGISWNDELDLDATSIYFDGEIIDKTETSLNQKIGFLLAKTREEQHITQSELAKISKIDQGDISKIEKGVGNPTLSKISKLFNSLGKVLDLTVL